MEKRRADGSGRKAAFDTLLACMAGEVYPDLKIKGTISKYRLDRRETAFAAHLVYGVLEKMLLLDYHINSVSSVKLKKLENRVLCLLRLGAFQLFFSSGVPVSAAVDETVKLAAASGNRGAVRYINAVLRALSKIRDPLDFSLPDKILEMSVKESHPRWIVEELTELLNMEGAAAALAANNRTPDMTVSVNTLKLTADELIEGLSEEGVSAELIPGVPGMLTLRGTGDIKSLRTFKSGGFYVQDISSRLAAAALNPQPFEKVLDLAAAPGGKTFAAILEMEDKGEVLSLDIHPHKAALIESGVKRLGFRSVRAKCMDAKKIPQELYGKFDRVICDVPCSGLGIIRKKPDIRYKEKEDQAALPALQYAILENGAKSLKPGGTLLYSTCTFRTEENGGVVDLFLSRHPEFYPIPFSLSLENMEAPEGKIQIWPHIHGADGFFICLLGKKDV